MQPWLVAVAMVPCCRATRVEDSESHLDLATVAAVGRDSRTNCGRCCSYSVRIVWTKVKHIFLKLLETLRNLVHLPSWPSWRRFRLYFAQGSPLRHR